MARLAATVVLPALLLFSAPSLLFAADVTLPNGIEAAQVDQPTQSTADLGDKPTYSEPDEVFNGNLQGVGDANAGIDEGNPGVTLTQGSLTNPNSGRKMLAQSGRKMLDSTLQLSGNGVSAGDNNLGESANAYGHGQLAGLDDSHIEPHGVDSTTTVGGQSTSTGAAVDPDCLAKEGPCTEVGRK